MRFYNIFQFGFKSPLSILIFRISLLMLTFSIIRALFYLMNIELFPNIDNNQLLTMFLGGLRFDLTAILYFNLLYIVLMLLPLKVRHNSAYTKYTNILFVFTNAIAIFMNLADIIYYRFTSRRSSIMIFDEFANESNYVQLLYHFLIDYYYILFLFIVLIWSLNFISKKLKPEEIYLSSWKYYVFHTILFPLVFSSVVVGVKSGVAPKQDFPLNPSDAGQYVKNPNDIAIVLNTPFTMLLSVDKPAFPKQNYFADEYKLNSIYNPIHSADTSSTQNRLNVVVLMVESLGRETIGYLNQNIDDGKYKGYTPFLDSLCQNSYVFLNSFANSHISIEGSPAVVASIPSLQESYTVSLYSGNKINSLASCLNKIGYESWYFHGAPNGSLGLSSFAKIASFENYIGKTEYNNDDDFDGVWGIWDHKFLPFISEFLNDKKEPFFSFVFTTSSHHPYMIPPELKGKFAEGKKGIHKSIRYADYSLKAFFESAKKQTWYINTLFIITGDHTCKSFYKEYKTTVGQFAVPIIFYQPESNLIGIDTIVAQQIDIMPTVLNYLNYPNNYFAFGHDLFKNDKNRFAVNYIGNSFQIIDNEWVLQYNLKETIGLYNLKQDKYMLNNLVGKSDTIQLDLEKKLKAFIQQYNNRMVEDRLMPI